LILPTALFFAHWIARGLKARGSKANMAEIVQYYGTGRRKAAIARVFLRPGSGEFKVNGKAFEEYFVTPSQRISAKSPLASTESAANFNVLANVCGGGVAGQADAVRLGITRALMEFNAELRGKLKAEGMVTRDPRAKERKKYGQKGARKRFQFSKR
jgi:small subunit ribosomal protein S9